MRNALTTTVLVVICSLSASAQSGTISGGTTAPLHRPFRLGPNSGRSLIGLSGVPFDGERHRRAYGRNSFFYGGWPYFPPEYEASEEPEVHSRPAVTVAAPVSQPRSEPVPDATLLELQGNQWVKVSSFSMPKAAGSSSSAASTVATELPPAILVYRDGHSEELSSYAIIGTTIFAKADYVTTGASTRKIQIADLDLPATLKRNRDRGVKFDLPSGPSEIILRP